MFIYQGEISTTNTNKKATEILVECGYCDSFVHDIAGEFLAHWNKPELSGVYEIIDFAADTLEGRRQAEAIEDWLVDEEWDLWKESSMCNHRIVETCHGLRLRRIKWSLEQLTEVEL